VVLIIAPPIAKTKKKMLIGGDDYRDTLSKSEN
jgi:hypothetical protein